MAQTHKGGCLCKAVRYEFSVEPLFAANCYCRQCQQATGSGYTTVMGFTEADISIQGETKKYTVISDAKTEVTRSFCPECGSQLFTHGETVPGLMFIKAASLDDPSWVTPELNCWTSSQQPWAPLAEAAVSFPGNPPHP